MNTGLMSTPTAIQQSPANYSYPLTTGLLSALQPAATQSQQAGSIPPGGPWSQLAYQMAGSPKQGGMYASVATPAAPAGSSSSSSSSSLSSLLPLLGVLGGTGALSGLLGGNGAASGANSLVSAIGGLLGATGNPGSMTTQNLANLMGTGSSASNPYGLTNSTGSDAQATESNAQLAADLGLTSSGATAYASNDPNAPTTDPLSFSSAGGQAAIQPVNNYGLTDAPTGLNLGTTAPTTSALGNAAGLLGIGQGLASGSPTGYAGAGLGATSLAAKNGLLGSSSSSTAGSLAGNGLSALGLYQGLQEGGVGGDLTAAANAAKLAGSLGSATGLLSSGAGSALGAVGGALAVPLSVYNLAKDWQSGNTGGDALQGAEAGASIGSIVPGIGTLIGGLVGGAAGAVSSAFGGGKQDPETQNTYAVNSSGSNAASNLNPAQSFQYLAGVMDAKNNTAGHSTALEQTFGRMGESNVLNGMAGQIDSAMKSGSITSTTPASTVFSQVITPWLTSQGVPASSLTFTDAKGTSSGSNLQSALTNLVGAYMNGSLTSSTQIGVAGQADSSLPSFS